MMVNRTDRVDLPNTKDAIPPARSTRPLKNSMTTLRMLVKKLRAKEMVF